MNHLIVAWFNKLMVMSALYFIEFDCWRKIPRETYNCHEPQLKDSIHEMSLIRVAEICCTRKCEPNAGCSQKLCREASSHSMTPHFPDPSKHKLLSMGIRLRRTQTSLPTDFLFSFFNIYDTELYLILPNHSSSVVAPSEKSLRGLSTQ